MFTRSNKDYGVLFQDGKRLLAEQLNTIETQLLSAADLSGGGDYTLHNNLTIHVNDGYTVTIENLTITEDFNVQGDIHSLGNILVDLDLTVQGQTALHGDVVIDGYTVVTGNVLIGYPTPSNIYLNGPTAITGVTTITGATTIAGAVNITDTVQLHKPVTLANTARIRKRIAAGGDADNFVASVETADVYYYDSAGESVPLTDNRTNWTLSTTNVGNGDIMIVCNHNIAYTISGPDIGIIGGATGQIPWKVFVYYGPFGGWTLLQLGPKN